MNLTLYLVFSLFIRWFCRRKPSWLLKVGSKITDDILKTTFVNFNLMRLYWENISKISELDRTWANLKKSELKRLAFLKKERHIELQKHRTMVLHINMGYRKTFSRTKMIFPMDFTVILPDGMNVKYCLANDKLYADFELS